MEPIIYRWHEISRGKRVFWGICVALMLVVAISLIVYGRGLSSAEAVAADRKRGEAATRRKEEDEYKKEADERSARASVLDSERRSFSSYAEGLVSIPALRSMPGRGYIKGKVVLLDLKEKVIDSINSDLRNDMRATTEAETGTVVWLDWREELVGNYSSGGGGYVYTCRLTVIDLSIPAKVAVRSFRGSDPPSYVTSQFYGQDHYGDKPSEKIISYLESLPKRY